VRALCPEVDRATAEHVFDLLLLRGLREAGNPSVAITWGVGRLMITRLIGDAANYLRDEFDIRLRARRLPKAFPRSWSFFCAHGIAEATSMRKFKPITTLIFQYPQDEISMIDDQLQRLFKHEHSPFRD
jgi:hypothetical protein